MAVLSAFLPLVAPWTPGAPDVAIENAALQAAIEFCSLSLCLQRTLASVATVVDQADYTLTQSGEVTTKLLAAWLDDRPLDLVTAASFDGISPQESSSAPGGLLWRGPMAVQLLPPPSVAGLALVVRAAMTPSQAATTIDDGLFERHAAAIAEGARAWLMSQPEKAYYKPNDAAACRGRMLEAAANEKAAAFYDRARSSRRRSVVWC